MPVRVPLKCPSLRPPLLCEKVRSRVRDVERGQYQQRIGNVNEAKGIEASRDDIRPFPVSTYIRPSLTSLIEHGRDPRLFLDRLYENSNLFTLNSSFNLSAMLPTQNDEFHFGPCSYTVGPSHLSSCPRVVIITPFRLSFIRAGCESVLSSLHGGHLT